MSVLAILSAMGLILLRVGVPVVLLVAVGLIIDRWQTRREGELRRQAIPANLSQSGDAEQETAAHRAA